MDVNELFPYSDINDNDTVAAMSSYSLADTTNFASPFACAPSQELFDFDLDMPELSLPPNTTALAEQKALSPEPHVPKQPQQTSSPLHGAVSSLAKTEPNTTASVAVFSSPAPAWPVHQQQPTSLNVPHSSVLSTPAMMDDDDQSPFTSTPPSFQPVFSSPPSSSVSQGSNSRKKRTYTQMDSFKPISPLTLASSSTSSPRSAIFSPFPTVSDTESLVGSSNDSSPALSAVFSSPAITSSPAVTSSSSSSSNFAAASFNSSSSSPHTFPYNFLFTRRNRDQVPQVRASNGALRPLVDYVRRDKGNTSKGRSEVVAKKRRRPRYINLLAQFIGTPNLSFHLYESDGVSKGKCLQHDLQVHLEKNVLYRVNVDAISPEEYVRDKDHWFCLEVQSGGQSHCLHFLLSWWKAKRRKRQSS